LGLPLISCTRDISPAKATSAILRDRRLAAKERTIGHWGSSQRLIRLWRDTKADLGKTEEWKDMCTLSALFMGHLVDDDESNAFLNPEIALHYPNLKPGPKRVNTEKLIEHPAPQIACI